MLQSEQMLAPDRSLDDLLAAIARGDRPAFRAFYNATAPRLLGIANRLLRRREWAEEMVQECMLRVWRKAARFDPERGSALTWVCVILRRLCLDRLSAERSHDDISAMEIASEQPDPTPEPKLGDCLGRLQPASRHAFLLAFHEGHTHMELAEHLNLPLGTVKSRIRRATLEMRDCLEAA